MLQNVEMVHVEDLVQLIEHKDNICGKEGRRVN